MKDFIVAYYWDNGSEKGYGNMGIKIIDEPLKLKQFNCIKENIENYHKKNGKKDCTVTILNLIELGV